MPQQELIQRWQNSRQESHRVFHKQYHLHPDDVHVVVGIKFVFEQLDYCKQQVDIAEPAEHVINAAEVLVGKPLRHLARKRRQHHKRHVGVKPLYHLCVDKRLADVDIRYGYNQVEMLLGQFFDRGGIIAHLRHTRRRTKVKGGIFKKQLLLDAAILFNHKRIVRRGNEQHVEHALLHQVLECRVLKI